MEINWPEYREFALKDKKALALEAVIIILLLLHCLLFLMPSKEKKEKRKVINSPSFAEKKLEKKILSRNSQNHKAPIDMENTLGQESTGQNYTSEEIMGIKIAKNSRNYFILHNNTRIDPSVFGLETESKELALPVNKENTEKIEFLKKRLFKGTDLKNDKTD